MTPFADEVLLATVDVCEETIAAATKCAYTWALNYDANAELDRGACLFPGCTDDEALNYDRQCGRRHVQLQPCPDFNGDGLVQITDLMDLLLVWGTEYD